MGHICVCKLTVIGSDNGLAPTRPLSEPMLEYYNWILGNKLQLNLNRNVYIFGNENAFELWSAK